MFGGLTKTSGRIAIAAALGLTLGGFAFKATPARAADLGGDCCADLEERVAELEATTVRKGNKKVSVTLSGWVVKAINWWDDSKLDGVAIGDKDYDLGSRFAITGSATISPGWSAGFNVTVNVQGDCFGVGSNQNNELPPCTAAATGFSGITTLYSYIYIKSDKWGTLNWGHLSPASDNPAVLADISGTVIESNGVFFEGPSFFLEGSRGTGLTKSTWGDFLQCQGLGAGIGVDCWGVAQPAVRYDSPTWGGFRFETSYGKNLLTGTPNKKTSTLQINEADVEANDGFIFTNTTGTIGSTRDSEFWDIALFYTGDWNSIKVSAAYAFTWIETGVDTGDEVNLHQVGASIWHKPSGLGIYGMYQREETDGTQFPGLLPIATIVDVDNDGDASCGNGGDGGATLVNGNDAFLDVEGCLNGSVFGAGAGFPFVARSNPDSDAWYIKPFWRKTWMPAGATVLFGEWGEYRDQFNAGQNLCLSGGGGANVRAFCAANIADLEDDTLAQTGGVFVNNSKVERWGLGVVQEIDSAAMHVWARWQHQQLNANFTGFSLDPEEDDGDGNGAECFEEGESCNFTKSKLSDSFKDWDLFQVGGVIFF